MSQGSELESIERLLANICRMHHDRARKLLNEIGLYRGQPPLLNILHKNEGLTQTELASRLGIMPATLTKMLQRMEKTGFVMRQADQEDQRVSRVYLTDAGRDIRSKMRAVLRSIATDTFKGFSVEERVQLHQLLLKVYENLDSFTE